MEIDAVDHARRRKRTREEIDRELDRQLEDTFPASDPTEITRERVDAAVTSKSPDEDADR